MALRVCPWWLSFFVGNALRRLIHDPDEILAGLVASGHTAVDIGCGPGFFTIAMAKLVGEDGRVIAADVQTKMLDYVRRRAEKTGLQSRIRLHHCEEDGLGIEERVDFALAFYMVHEVPSVDAFLNDVAGILKPGAALLLVEPKMHVTDSRFKEIVRTACAAGLEPGSEVQIRGSRGMLFSAGTAPNTNGSR
jgi:ubiquinone/menaquinone biosynthesis C-methylase UbiE